MAAHTEGTPERRHQLPTVARRRPLLALCSARPGAAVDMLPALFVRRLGCIRTLTLCSPDDVSFSTVTRSRHFSAQQCQGPLVLLASCWAAAEGGWARSGRRSQAGPFRQAYAPACPWGERAARSTRSLSRQPCNVRILGPSAGCCLVRLAGCTGAPLPHTAPTCSRQLQQHHARLRPLLPANSMRGGSGPVLLLRRNRPNRKSCRVGMPGRSMPSVVCAATADNCRTNQARGAVEKWQDHRQLHPHCHTTRT